MVQFLSIIFAVLLQVGNNTRTFKTHWYQNQGHLEFPFGNSRESATSKIPSGNSRELLSFRREFLKFPILFISCCELWKLADMKTYFPPFYEFKSLKLLDSRY